MGDFIAILAQLKRASDTFDTGARDFRNAVPDNLAGNPVDSGSAALDSAVTAVLDGIDVMHLWIADTLTRTSAALLAAHNDYQNTDQDSARELYDTMLADDPVG